MLSLILLTAPLVSATLGLCARHLHRSPNAIAPYHRSTNDRAATLSPHFTRMRSLSQLQRQGHLVRLVVARRPVRLGRGRQGPLPAQLRRLLAHVLRPRRLVRRVGEGRRVHQIARLHAQGVPDVVRPLRAQVRRHLAGLQPLGQGGQLRLECAPPLRSFVYCAFSPCVG